MEAASSGKRKTTASSVATPTKKARAAVVTSMPPPALKNRATSEDHDEQSQSAFVDTKGAVSEDHNEQSQHAFINTKDTLVRTKKPTMEEGTAEASAMADLHCPRCDFHLGALQAVVTPTKLGTKVVDAPTP